MLGSPEGEPKCFGWAFMPLRSLPPSGSCPCSAACPIWCRPRGADARRPASVRTCHQGTLRPHAFFGALRVAAAPAGCWFVSSANARLETRSSTAFRRSPPVPMRRHRPASSLSASRLPVRPSAARPRDLPGREWPSASRPLLSLCWSAPRSTRCDKNAPCTSATALRDKTPRGSPPVPGTCQKQTAARPSAHALSSAAETLSNWPCLPSSLPPPPVLREIPRHLRPSPPTAKHCAPRHPSCASTTNHRGTPMHGCPRSPDRPVAPPLDLRIDLLVQLAHR